MTVLMWFVAVVFQVVALCAWGNALHEQSLWQSNAKLRNGWLATTVIASLGALLTASIA